MRGRPFLPLSRRWSRPLVAAVVASAACSHAAPAQAAAFPASAVDAIIDSAYPASQPGGVVLVSRGARILHHRAFGMANLEWGIPMTTDAVFSLASLTKQFTAVAVLQLAEQRRLALTDSIGTFLPRLSPVLRRVTIDQLLSHTAGVENPRDTGKLLAIGRGWLSAAQILSVIPAESLAFAPGSQWAYSNSGYQLLGAVVEAIVKEPLPEYVERTLLKPAGMTQSLWGNDMRVVPRRAAPYLFVRDRIENAVNPNVQIAWAAGALQGTAGDLHRWQRWLVSGGALRDSTLRRAWTASRTTAGVATDYGFGWYVGSLAGRRLVEHGGNMGGFMSHMIFVPDEELLVVVLLNGRGNRLPELTAADIAALVLGAPHDYTPRVAGVRELEELAGAYRDARGDTVTIGLEGGRLYYQRGRRPRLGMVLLRSGGVHFENTAIIGSFFRSVAGRVDSLVIQTHRGNARSVLIRADRP